MPPHSFPISFEEVEAKEWASNTMKTLFTDVSVSFESNITTLAVIEEEEKIPKRKTKKQRGSLKRVSTLRRSFSFLETSLFRSHHDQPKKPSRVLSTVLTDYQTIRPEPQPRENTGLKGIFSLDSYLHKTSSKERKGIAIWKSTFAAYSLESSLKFKPNPISKRSVLLSRFIRTELLTTEDTYLSHLMTIKKYYMDPLFQAATQKRSLVNLKDMEIIFAHIPQLINVSSFITECLHKVIKVNCEEQDSAPIGKIFCDLQNHFDVYIAYAVNFTKSRKYLKKASSNIVYHQLVKDSMRKKKTNRMLLADYMIAPIQRITRYSLLLKDLQKHSAPTDADLAYLDKAINFLSALAFAMNHVQ